MKRSEKIKRALGFAISAAIFGAMMALAVYQAAECGANNEYCGGVKAEKHE